MTTNYGGRHVAIDMRDVHSTGELVPIGLAAHLLHAADRLNVRLLLTADRTLARDWHACNGADGVNPRAMVDLWALAYETDLEPVSDDVVNSLLGDLGIDPDEPDARQQAEDHPGLATWLHDHGIAPSEATYVVDLAWQRRP